MAGEVLTGGLANVLWNFGPGVEGNGRTRSGRMNDTTDENSDETADSAESSTELEDTVRFRGPSDDLRFAGSNDDVFGGLFTVATPSYWCRIGSIYAPELLERNLPLHGPTPSS